MIRSEHMKSCLAAQISCMLFKGPGSFKNFFKIGGNVDELKAYRLIPLTLPLLFHFTLPLRDAVQTMNQRRIEVPCVNGDEDRIRSVNHEIADFFLVRAASPFTL
jgi:hypothetical protein